MKILNLYAGIGAHRKKWQGHEVTAVEINPKIAAVYKKLHPADTVITGDARKYLQENFENFDFVWSSPPCQSASQLAIFGQNRDNKKFPDLSLYEEILFLKWFFKGGWCVENVVPFYQPLLPPTAEISRHLFWSNFHISAFDIKKFPAFLTSDNAAGLQKMKDWLGIQFTERLYYEKNHSPQQVLRNATHPDIGLHVLTCFTLQPQEGQKFIYQQKLF